MQKEILLSVWAHYTSQFASCIYEWRDFMQKRFWCFIFATVLCSNMLTPSFAVDKQSPVSEAINNYHEECDFVPDIKTGDILPFVDPSLQGVSKTIQPHGEITEEYDHSYYTIKTYAITAYDVGPREKDVFLISIARGETDSLKNSVTLTATASFNASVSATAKQVICGELGLTASGGFSTTWEIGRTFIGPDAPYNSRTYYGAINYDRYSFTLKRYDIYKVYNGTSYVKDVEYYVGEESVSLKCPKPANYSVDSIQ